MAQILDQQDEEKDKKNQSTAPTLNVGQSANVTNGAATPANQNKVAGSGRFSNLQRFVGANQQAPKEYEQNISGKINQQAQGLQGQIQGRLNQGQQLAQGERQRLNQGQQMVGQIKNNAVGLANNKDSLDQLGNIREGVYNNNINLGDTSQIQQGIGGLQESSNLAQTGEGRKQLLANAYNQNNNQQYGTGARRADQLLLQTDPTSAGRLRDNALNQLNTTQGGLNSAQQQLAVDQQDISGQAGNLQNLFNTEVNTGLSNIQNSAKEQTDVINRFMNTGEMNRNEYNALDPEFKSRIDSLLGKYSTDTKRTYDPLATKGQIDNQKALETLLNKSSSFGLGSTNNMDSYLAERANREDALRRSNATEVERINNDITNQTNSYAKQLSDQYYNDFGKNTGQGFDKGRDPYQNLRDLLTNSISGYDDRISNAQNDFNNENTKRNLLKQNVIRGINYGQSADEDNNLLLGDQPLSDFWKNKLNDVSFNDYLTNQNNMREIDPNYGNANTLAYDSNSFNNLNNTMFTPYGYNPNALTAIGQKSGDMIKTLSDKTKELNKVKDINNDNRFGKMFKLVG